MTKLVLMREDKEIATITLQAGSISFERIGNETLPAFFERSHKQTTMTQFKDWLDSRMVPANRIDIRNQLSLMGLDCYRHLPILRKTKAALIEDPYWIKTSPEDDFFKDTPRGRLKSMGFKW